MTSILEADTLEVDVEVTQEDLDTGKMGNCTECPGAIAITRAVAEALGTDLYTAMVSGTGVQMWPRGTLDASNFHRLVAILAPHELRELVRRVDNPDVHGEAFPVKFHLSLRWRP